MTKYKPLFISVEGVDGSGKSTQIKKLAQKLEAMGVDVVLTREPGGVPVAEDIRAMLLTGDTDKFDAKSEAMLFYTARNEHLRQLILPSVEAGKVVLTDRFADSTMAFQHYGRGYDRGFIEMLHKSVVGDNNPDLTLMFMLSPKEALKRANARMTGDADAEDRMEKEGVSFQERIAKGFAEIAEQNPERCVIIDADGSMDEVAERVWAVVSKRLELEQ